MAPTALASPDASALRVQALLRAVHAMLEGDSAQVGTAFVPDVRATLPEAVFSATALAVEIEDRFGAFAEVDLRFVTTRVFDDEVWAEWTASVVHVGPFGVGDVLLDPSGARSELRGVTIAEFTGLRIAAFRQYWDISPLLHP